MRQLELTDFNKSVGESFEVEAGDLRLPLTLGAAEKLSAAYGGGGRAPFRLEWLGPFDPVLPQAIYRMTRGGETYEIFIVPVGRDQQGTSYEAIFT